MNLKLWLVLFFQWLNGRELHSTSFDPQPYEVIMGGIVAGAVVMVITFVVVEIIIHRQFAKTIKNRAVKEKPSR